MEHLEKACKLYNSQKGRPEFEMITVGQKYELIRFDVWVFLNIAPKLTIEYKDIITS